MPTTCCVLGCCSSFVKGNDIQFFTFPFKDEARLAAWTSAINRPSWAPKKSSKVCSKHFIPNDYLDRPGGYVKHLKSNAVPSVSLSYPISMHSRQEWKTSNEEEQNENNRNMGDNGSTDVENQIMDNVNEAMDIDNSYIANKEEMLFLEQRPVISIGASYIVFMFSQEQVNRDKSIYLDNARNSGTERSIPSYKLLVLRHKIRMLQQQVRRKNKKINSLNRLLTELKKQHLFDSFGSIHYVLQQKKENNLLYLFFHAIDGSSFDISKN